MGILPSEPLLFIRYRFLGKRDIQNCEKVFGSTRKYNTFWISLSHTPWKNTLLYIIAALTNSENYYHLRCLKHIFFPSDDPCMIVCFTSQLKNNNSNHTVTDLLFKNTQLKFNDSYHITNTNKQKEHKIIILTSINVVIVYNYCQMGSVCIMVQSDFN